MKPTYEELVEALKWLNFRTRSSLSGLPVRDMDEVLVHVENLLARIK